MKRTAAALLAGLCLVVCLYGCTEDATAPEAPTDEFLAWIAQRGIPSVPAVPMTGLHLGEVAAGQVVGSYVPGQGPGQNTSGPLDGRGWLYYLDEAPGALYQHPGRILVMGADGQVIYEEQTEGWPTVDGVRPPELTSPSTDDYYHAVVWNPWHLVKPVVGVKDWVVSAVSSRVRGAVVVNGVREGENLAADVAAMHAQVVEEMENMFGADNVATLPPASADASTALARIEAAVSRLVEDQNVAFLTLYLIGHGFTDGMVLDGGAFRPADLRELVNAFPQVRFAVLLETCHAGSWLNDFSGEQAIENLGLVIASTSADKSAWPDWDAAETAGGDVLTDFDPSDAYIEWTSDFLESLSRWTTGEDWRRIESYAATHRIPLEWALYYHAFFSVKGAPSIPPPAGFSAGATTYTMGERTGVEIQTPEIWTSWFIYFPDD